MKEKYQSLENSRTSCFGIVKAFVSSITKVCLCSNIFTSITYKGQVEWGNLACLLLLSVSVVKVQYFGLIKFCSFPSYSQIKRLEHHWELNFYFTLGVGNILYKWISSYILNLVLCTHEFSINYFLNWTELKQIHMGGTYGVR